MNLTKNQLGRALVLHGNSSEHYDMVQ